MAATVRNARISRLVHSRQAAAEPRSRGLLNPGATGVELKRFELGPELAEVVRHVWVARWDLPRAEVSAQRVLTYPTFNVVLMPGGAALWGPDPKLHVRELSGRGWAVGLLLRPAAGVLLAPVPVAALVGASRPLPDAPTEAVERAMRGGDLDRVARLVSTWLGPVAARVDARGRRLNRVCRLAEEDESLVRVAQLARRAGVSPRSLERLVVSHLGVTPKWLIECRRLQLAATTLYTRPDTALTDLALSLQYVDYAHFSRRYKEVIGETPDQTRASARPSR